ncbi:hypothetical protein [Haloferax volcanii]|uniref:Uncharacterized protein n=1 Tax=Haloferax volcanii JCM 10717 TaxID=1227458 RepID=M0ID97_HALVO|nr:MULTISPECIES: hypothetical protein [Haloferax]ELK55015.1 hypothetical protein D320_06869 [Haloferax sp. BAB-2207]ELZ94736.1 hypothetical protein C452_01595 [Haloferax alexandrinus JCM 10717]
MELQITELEDLVERVGNAPTRIGELQAGTRVQSDTFFSQSFMRDHTEFDSFAGFCEQSPWEFDDIDDARDISRDRLNEYIVATTDFETWEGMKTQAAEEEIIDQLVS